MPSIVRTFSVQFEHRVHFTRGVFNPSNSLLQTILSDPPRIPKVLVVLDESLASAWPELARLIENHFAALRDQLNLVCPPFILEGGERCKTSYFHVSEIHSQIERFHIDRHSYVLAVGGGALLDVAGLAAATAHRGVRHVRIPTTVLGQNDSGVGVKNGINAFGKKNFIGTFAPPFAVINDSDFLATLSDRDKRAGYAEAVKVALIRDRSYFESLEQDAPLLARFEPAAMQRMIHRSAELHVQHIASGGDPFEFGSARPLDFGHWAAHKIEQLSDFHIRHGEAVAIGMAIDLVYSRNISLLDAASAERILRLLEALGFELFSNELLHLDGQQQPMVLHGLEEFREHLGGELTLTMLQGIGRGVEIHDVALPRMLDAISELRQRQRRAQNIAQAC
ncbi:MAG TPA: 3-dehydroquinate synthase [Candidatus Baltobacteraceae bacterium]|jgi:3-dehydroquinate synthase|nr:3-dehydroquinate synthase [Candidatus Baltobacteraceae bacterium]